MRLRIPPAIQSPAARRADRAGARAIISGFRVFDLHARPPPHRRGPHGELPGDAPLQPQSAARPPQFALRIGQTFGSRSGCGHVVFPRRLHRGFEQRVRRPWVKILRNPILANSALVSRQSRPRSAREVGAYSQPICSDCSSVFRVSYGDHYGAQLWSQRTNAGRDCSRCFGTGPLGSEHSDLRSEAICPGVPPPPSRVFLGPIAGTDPTISRRRRARHDGDRDGRGCSLLPLS